MSEIKQPGNELGQALKNEVEDKEPVSGSLSEELAPPPMSDRSGNKKGNLQDEKDETEE